MVFIWYLYGIYMVFTSEGERRLSEQSSLFVAIRIRVKLMCRNVTLHKKEQKFQLFQGNIWKINKKCVTLHLFSGMRGSPR